MDPALTCDQRPPRNFFKYSILISSNAGIGILWVVVYMCVWAFWGSESFIYDVMIFPRVLLIAKWRYYMMLIIKMHYNCYILHITAGINVLFAWQTSSCKLGSQFALWTFYNILGFIDMHFHPNLQCFCVSISLWVFILNLTSVTIVRS